MSEIQIAVKYYQPSYLVYCQSAVMTSRMPTDWQLEMSLTYMSDLTLDSQQSQSKYIDIFKLMTIKFYGANTITSMALADGTQLMDENL